MKITCVILAFMFACCLVNGCAFATEDDVKQNIHTLLTTNSCEGCNLAGADFLRAKLKGASLGYSILDGASFCLAVLSGADFEGASLRNVQFCGADISDANFIDADLTNTSFVGVYDRGTIYKRREISGQKVNTGSLSNDIRNNVEKPVMNNTNTSVMPPIISISAPQKKKIKKINPMKIGQ